MAQVGQERSVANVSFGAKQMAFARQLVAK
jgi:hypothetical protein